MNNVPAGLTSDEVSEISFFDGLAANGTLDAVNFDGWTGRVPPAYNDFYGSAHKWGGGTAGTAGGTVAYAFDPGSNWSAAEQSTFRAAMAVWSDEADISFVQASSPAQAQLSFYRYGTDTAPASVRLTAGGTYTVANYDTGTVGSPEVPAITSAYIQVDTTVPGWTDLGSITADHGYDVNTVVHEMGHVLGLGHGGPYNGSVDPSTDQFGPYDNRQWSVMSYIYPDDPSAKYSASSAVPGTTWTDAFGDDYNSATPMPLDIAAVQQMYGVPAGSALSGGQTFGFNCDVTDASRELFDFTQDTTPVVTLWDSGGYNTLDLSGYSNASVIDLNPGGFSSCGGLVNNVGIAYGSKIDNAVGGAGDDTFVLNAFGDSVDGRGGVNTVVLQGTEAQYAFAQVAGYLTVTPGSGSLGGTDHLTNIQDLTFAGSGVTIATASLTATAVPTPTPVPTPTGNFEYVDQATNLSGADGGQAYTGPVSYLQTQFIWPGADSVAITATVPNVFLKGGPADDALAVTSGSNVLDGGTGSNFLNGAMGTDGGTDTFFVDGRGSGDTWSTLVNFHVGDAATLWGFVPGQSVMNWAASDGTAGYAGATIHAALAGAGAAADASLTFAGMSLADAQSKFTTTTGTVGGNDYMYLKYAG